MIIQKIIKKYFVLEWIIKITLIFLSKLIKIKNRLGDNNSKKVLVICFSKIGDTIFTIASINYLLGKYKDNLIIATYEENLPIFNRLLSKNLNLEFISKKDIYFQNRIANPLAVLRFNFLKYDIIYDFTSSILSGSILFCLRANCIYGLKEPYINLLHSQSVSMSPGDTLQKMYFNVINLVDSEAVCSDYFSYDIKKFDKVKILINPFGGWEAKEWGIGNFIELFKKLSMEFCVDFNLERARFEDVKKEFANIDVNRIKLTDTLNDLISLLDSYTIFIGNDSGPLYLAAALGIPTFAIYGPTNPLLTFPDTRGHAFIQNQIYCSPKENEKVCKADGGRNGCDYFKCMAELKNDVVYSKLKNYILNLKLNDGNKI